MNVCRPVLALLPLCLLFTVVPNDASPHRHLPGAVAAHAYRSGLNCLGAPDQPADNIVETGLRRRTTTLVKPVFDLRGHIQRRTALPGARDHPICILSGLVLRARK